MFLLANRVNIHFENSLAGLESRQNEQFDFIHFLIEKSETPLYTKIVFNSEYLEHLDELGFQTNFTAQAEQISDWWAMDTDSKLCHQLNSKIFVYEFLKSKNLVGSESVIVHNEDELRQVPLDFQLIRLNYSVSGKGTFLRGDRRVKKFPCLVTRLKERQFDIGTKVFKDGIVPYINLVDRFFCFRGQLFLQDEWLSKRIPLLSKIEEKATILKQALKEEFNVEEIQFDSFIYQEEGVEKIEFAHEFNYRRTMGDLYHRIKEMSLIKSPFAFISFLMLPKDCDFLATKNTLSNEGILLLSPLKRGLNIFVLEGNSFEQIHRKIDCLYQILGLSKKAVYNDLIATIARVIQVNEH